MLVTTRPLIAVMCAALAVAIPSAASVSIDDASTQRAGAPPPTIPSPQPGQRGRGRGGGRGIVPTMSLTAPWTDGGDIPLKYTQAGGEVSPALSWSNAPEKVGSFVLMVRDLDAVNGSGQELLHWLVWNIPGTATNLPEGVPAGWELDAGMRQISATGPEYRGPGAPAGGPRHHYAFELYALDATIDVPAGASAAETRAAVLAAMAQHVIAKGTVIGVFKRTQM